jgi:DNA-binding NarL/FixJ family response regulator
MNGAEPRAEMPQATGSPASPMALLVEDEPMFQTLISEAFAELDAGWRVIACGTGAEALSLLRSLGPELSLVLVDLGLPDLDGTEIIRAAVSLPTDVPVLVASIHSDERHVIDAIRAGARGYLLKDDSALAITDSIRRVLEGEYPISPSLARYLFKIASLDAGAVQDGEDIAIAPKELALLQLLSKGHTYKTAARTMDVSLSTVQTYVRRVYEKLGVHSRTEALARARESGLLG